MTKKVIQYNNEVSLFLDALNHPFRNEIEKVRGIVLTANNLLSENIKWNGPNYSINNEDRITMRVQPPGKQLQLIFHRGAKKQTPLKKKLISLPSKMLVWKENDRAVVTFKSKAEIEKAEKDLSDIVCEWIAHSKSP